MKRRVVVTGMGAVTPIGNTVEEFLETESKQVKLELVRSQNSIQQIIRLSWQQK